MKVLISVSIAMCMVCSARAVTFTTVADTSTLIPGHNTTFTDFANADHPSISDGNVSFRGLGTDAASIPTDGIYAYDHVAQSLEVIADTNTPIPGGALGELFATGTSIGFSSPSISGLDVAFGGTGPGGNDRGVYARFAGTALQEIADTRGSSVFSTLGGPSISDGNISMWTFIPASPNFEGIYRHHEGPTGSLGKVVDESDVVNGVTPVRRYDGFAASGADQDGPETAFIARDTTGQTGIYRTFDFGGGLFAVSNPRVYPDDPIPDSGGEFFDLSLTSNLSFDDGDVVFKGQNSDLDVSGIYFLENSTISTVADNSTPVPGDTGNFSSFFDASVEGTTDNVVFLARDAGDNKGLYVRFDGILGLVIEVGDSLDGKVVDDLGFGHEGYDGVQAVFRASFTDGSEGIYIADTSDTSPPLSVRGKSYLGIVFIDGATSISLLSFIDTGLFLNLPLLPPPGGPDYGATLLSRWQEGSAPQTFTWVELTSNFLTQTPPGRATFGIGRVEPNPTSTAIAGVLVRVTTLAGNAASETEIGFFAGIEISSALASSLAP